MIINQVQSKVRGSRRHSISRNGLRSGQTADMRNPETVRGQWRASIQTVVLIPGNWTVIQMQGKADRN